jgi:hypothetical protein
MSVDRALMADSSYAANTSLHFLVVALQIVNVDVSLDV